MAVFLVRLYVVQIVYGEEFRIRAERQYVSALVAPFDRGSIFYTRKDGGQISAATLASGFTLAINPRDIGDPDIAYARLSEFVEITEDAFLHRANKIDDPYEEILHEVPQEIGQQIAEADIPGVILVRDRWRYYPGDNRAAHTIGFVAYDEDKLEGRYGLERYYEEVLSRESKSLYVNFFAEVFANLGSIIFDRESASEGHLVTTLEPTVQGQLENVLLGIQEEWGSNESAGIIINPKTGAIYAMASVPSFDLNRFEEASSARYRNPLVENVYEFGSIFKPITVTAGIDSGAITENTTYFDRGKIIIDGATVSNFDGKGRGEVLVQEILSQSLNTGVAFVVQEMGIPSFKKYLKNLRVGEEVGIDLPNEVKGLTSNLESPRELEYVTASFGQGIALTPIGMVRALSAVANGGVLVQPHIGKEIRHPSGLITKLGWGLDERVFKESSSQTVSRMLTKVVDEALLGGTVKIDSMSVAAKTGTAQIASPDGGYYDDRYLHSFFGYFPSYDPEFLIFLYTVEPKEVRYASQTLTNPFIDLVSFLTNYYDVEPDRLYENIP
ncbi:MAG: peptidoglycan D,D-transpeptidase FtsI family protein [Patescibacteria group bacterium UBA2103]